VKVRFHAANNAYITLAISDCVYVCVCVF